MLRFGFLYVDGRFLVYDVSQEQVQGRTLYVAALSHAPQVRFAAVRPENAVDQLIAHLGKSTSAVKPVIAQVTPR